MDRLIMKQIDPDHKPLGQAQREAARRAKGSKPPREAEDYRGTRRNARSHSERTNPSTGKGYQGPIALNRSQHWKYAETYFDARDLSSSSRDVV